MYNESPSKSANTFPFTNDEFTATPKSKPPWLAELLKLTVYLERVVKLSVKGITPCSFEANGGTGI
ncbi:MAG: hypothetical protein BWY67_02286 [Bacteroidetes bacterium ADurb.Bin397]|nr:MAG: hypothetical protein BWY67_02286 [Bacteroidetes bacterium ADurb.Bin397]